MTIRRLPRTLPPILLALSAGMAAVMRVSDAAPPAKVVLPPDSFSARLPKDVAIRAVTPVSLTLQSGRAGFARLLYGAGARLVLPAGLTGRLPRPAALR